MDELSPTSVGALPRLSARRLLLLGGIALIVAGMIFGDFFAVFILHQNASRVGASLAAASHAALQGDAFGVAANFANIGSFLENRGTKVDAHVHAIEFGYLALLLAVVTPWISLSEKIKRALAFLFLVGSVLLPVGVFLIHYVGLAHSPLTSDRLGKHFRGRRRFRRPARNIDLSLRSLEIFSQSKSNSRANLRLSLATSHECRNSPADRRSPLDPPRFRSWCLLRSVRSLSPRIPRYLTPLQHPYRKHFTQLRKSRTSFIQLRNVARRQSRQDRCTLTLHRIWHVGNDPFNLPALRSFFRSVDAALGVDSSGRFAHSSSLCPFRIEIRTIGWRSR